VKDRAENFRQNVAMIGVILSLLFVGYEIRQNTKMIQGATIQAISDQSIAGVLSGAADSEWVRILSFFDQGGTFEELGPDDKMRFNMRASATARMMENRWRQTQLGVLDESGLEVGTGIRNTGWYQSDHFKAYWEHYDMHNSMDPEFVEFMETEVMRIR
jgi:hypothetical protein